MLTILKRLRTVAAGSAVLAAALASPSAWALAQFSVNPNSNGLSAAGTPFTADTLSGTSSARITRDAVPGNHYTGVGYVIFTAFNLNSSPIYAGTSQLNLTNSGYGLYATFTQHFTCSSPLGVWVSCGVDSITLDMWGDPGNHDVKNLATLAAAPTITDLGAANIKLATVTQVVSGLAGLDALGGAFQNINSNFNLTAAGKLFFTSPDPFYQLAFSAFNNTSQGLACDTVGCANPGVVSINSESGITDFLRVPEPGSLVLMGVALLGMATVSRKRA